MNDGGRLGEHLLASASCRPMRRLQHGERQRPAVAPGEHLAVEHRAVGQQRRPASTSSGKRSVISSSPRDQRKTAPPRRMSCARMPSHFHSACHSPALAERLRRLLERRGEVERVGARGVVVAGAPGRGCARRTRPTGAQVPIRRWATTRRRQLRRPAASARTTSVCETPTRSSPVSSLLSRNSSRRSAARATSRSPRAAAPRRSGRAGGGAAPPSSARGASRPAGSAGRRPSSSRAIISARSPTAA